MKKSAVVVAGAVLALGLGGPAFADTGAKAEAVATNSPGILSGNVTQVPISIPINICGNSINAAAALNPAFGNICINR
ncbi:membrane protein [Streptomyces lucensis JCM 4490]|uniref:Membrane protein n=1 Tax=Streptomyces lucensis JCM 4490 TaxID=1306176 RepID=A0A918IYG3_9ACTN|nr:chaplin [Streptomyces lucensis]GGW36825.1 membrane protein [Streptomyces lucensis JCM 4490]